MERERGDTGERGESPDLPSRRVPGSPMGGTTGVSLEQGLGLTDVPRGFPGVGDERSYAPDYYLSFIKNNPSASRSQCFLARLGTIRASTDSELVEYRRNH